MSSEQALKLVQVQTRDHRQPKPFAQFPKTRPSLPPEFKAIYAQTYKSNRQGTSAASGLAQKLESWMHLKVAEDVRDCSSTSTLEIGAGTLNHLRYEQGPALYDIVEPFRYLFDSSTDIHRVRKVYGDVQEVPDTSRYRRIISIATFEHICDLPQVVAKCGLLLSDSGHLRVAIPSEGTVLWSLGWHLTTGLEFRWKHDLDYGVLMRHEHVNTAAEIEEILKYFFRRIEAAFFGISKSFSFYQFYDCSEPDLERCHLIA